MKTCPKCNSQLQDDIKFCTNCGTNVENLFICPICGKSMEQESKFCVHCGSKLDKESVAKAIEKRKQQQAELERMAEEAKLKKAQEQEVAKQKALDERIAIRKAQREFAKREDKKMIIVVIAIIALVTIGLLFVAKYLNGDGDDTDVKEEISEETISQKTETNDYDIESVDEMESAQEVRGVLPTFTEIKEFIFSENQSENLKDYGMSLLAEYEEEPEGSEAGILKHDKFYGINSTVTYTMATNEYGYSSPKYSFSKTSEHCMIIAFYGGSDMIPVIYFSQKEDWDKCKQQADSDEDIGYWCFDENYFDGLFKMKGWYVMMRLT